MSVTGYVIDVLVILVIVMMAGAQRWSPSGGGEALEQAPYWSPLEP